MLNFDIIYNIILLLDVKNIRNFLLISKKIYKYKKINICHKSISYIDNVICNKIKKSHGLDSDIYNLEYNSDIIKQLNCIYSNFSKYENIEKIIIYISYKQNSDILVKYLINICNSNCKFIRNNNFQLQVNSIRYTFSYESIEYLLIYTSLDVFKHILNVFNIPIIILKKVLSIIYTKNINIKIKILIDNILRGQHNNLILYDIGSTHFTSLLIELIQYNKYDVIYYIFSQKNNYNIYFNYNKLINCAIQVDNLDILYLIYSNYSIDNLKIRSVSLYDHDHDHDHHLQRIIIQPISIELMCENGQFNTIHFILNKLLGDTINAYNYINSISKGLNTFIIRNNYDNVVLQSDKFCYLLSNLTQENQEFILSKIYNK